MVPDAQMVDSELWIWRFVNPKMEVCIFTEAGKTAENLAEMYNISREDQDAFCLSIADEGNSGAQFGSTGTGNNGCSHTSKTKARMPKFWTWRIH